MNFSNTKEAGFESLIVDWRVQHNGYEEGNNSDYDKEYAIDETRLLRFLRDTQPTEVAKLGIDISETKKRQFFNRLSSEITKRGIMTDYLWKDILTKAKLSHIIENYAQVIAEEDEETKKKKIKQVFPRYHQLDVVEKLLADVRENGMGKRYLIQHSAGFGKSNSIAWLAHQLIGLEKNGKSIIDTILVVTDRKILDKQICNTIKQFMQVKNTVVWAEHSGDLRKAI